MRAKHHDLDHVRLAIIGFGAIAHDIIASLEARRCLHLLSGILTGAGKQPPAHNVPCHVSSSLDEILKTRPTLFIEAAGHDAVAEVGPAILESSTDLLVASVGALAEPSLLEQLSRLSTSRSSVWAASGAIAGLDGLLASRSAGLRSVTYTSLKPAHAWAGTAAAQRVSPAGERNIFFRGTAREAAALYPKNANVAATIAFAGLGLDQTIVELGADNTIPGPVGIIDAEGDFGRFHFDILALASPLNPKTSFITGHSLVSAALDGMRFRITSRE